MRNQQTRAQPACAVVGVLQGLSLSFAQTTSMPDTAQKYCTPLGITAAARDIPDSKLVELPDVGHIPHEAPDFFTRRFLSSCAPAAK